MLTWLELELPGRQGSGHVNEVFSERADREVRLILNVGGATSPLYGALDWIKGWKRGIHTLAFPLSSGSALPVPAVPALSLSRCENAPIRGLVTSKLGHRTTSSGLPPAQDASQRQGKCWAHYPVEFRSVFSEEQINFSPFDDCSELTPTCHLMNMPGFLLTYHKRNSHTRSSTVWLGPLIPT